MIMAGIIPIGQKPISTTPPFSPGLKNTIESKYGRYYLPK
jgi:hypothetical protein